MKLSKKALIGYPAGVVTGVTYGLNPLFAIPLMAMGAALSSILFFRYAIAVTLLGLYLAVTGHSFRVTWRQGLVLLVLGLLYTASSLTLFSAYKYVPSGLATTLVCLSPVIVALILAALGKVPSWPVWLAIAVSFVGVMIMTGVGSGTVFNPTGIALAIASAFVYSLFIIIINRSKVIAGISNSVLTFYTLVVGSIVFMAWGVRSHVPLTGGLEGWSAWLNLVGLAVLPTIVSTATLAVATRNIGATKASVLGVFEPITAIVVGSMVLGEPLTLSVVAGITLSIVAVTFMILATGR